MIEPSRGYVVLVQAGAVTSGRTFSRPAVGRGLIALAGVAAAVLLIIVGRPAMMHAGPGDCDNLAGECLAHARQVKALLATGWIAYLAALCSLAAAVWVLARRSWILPAIVILVALALGIVGQAIDPVSHLQDPRHGWFSGHDEW